MRQGESYHKKEGEKRADAKGERYRSTGAALIDRIGDEIADRRVRCPRTLDDI